MISYKRKDILVELISGFYILLFVYAALTKIQDFEKFKLDLGKSPVLVYLADYMAIAIPAIELIITCLYLTKRTQLLALYLSFGLMVMFTTYIIGILNFSSYIPCSCGGILQHMTWSQHLVFNSFFVLLGGTAIFIYPKKENLLQQQGKPKPLIVGNNLTTKL